MGQSFLVAMKKLLLLVVFLLLLSAPLASAQPQEAAVYTIKMTYRVQNTGQNEAVNVNVGVYLFGRVSGWGNQEVISERITLDGEEIFPEIVETEDNRWTKIALGDLAPGETKVVEVVQVLKVGAVDLEVDPEKVGTEIPQELLIYTQPVAGLWESDDPEIRLLVQRLTENTNNLYQKARQIFDQLVEKTGGGSLLRYETQPVEHGALWALQNGRGDCTEFSNLMVALLRAAGIPAKVVSGYAFLPLYNPAGVSENADVLGHAYVIFYLPNYGWIPADAVWPRYVGSFGRMDYTHIAGASVGGDEAVNPDGISWPSPGHVSWNFEFYSGQPTELLVNSTGTIEAEILLQSLLQASPQLENGIMTVMLTVKNMGREGVRNLVAELHLDNAMFEALTTKREKAALASQEQWITSFAVRVKEPAYGTTQQLNSSVVFESSDSRFNAFLSKSSDKVTIAAVVTSSPTLTTPPREPTSPATSSPELTPPPTTPPPDLTIFLLFGVLVTAVVLFAAVMARR